MGHGMVSRGGVFSSHEMGKQSDSHSNSVCVCVCVILAAILDLTGNGDRNRVKCWGNVLIFKDQWCMQYNISRNRGGLMV